MFNTYQDLYDHVKLSAGYVCEICETADATLELNKEDEDGYVYYAELCQPCYEANATRYADRTKVELAY